MVALKAPDIVQVTSAASFHKPLAEYVRRGETYFLEGNLRAALEEFELAISISPADPRLLFAHGTLLAQLSDNVGALHDFERMVQLAGSQPQLLKYGLWSLGVALFWLDRPSESLNALTKALELDEGDPQLWAAKAVVLDSLGKQKEAVTALHRSLSLRDDPKVREAKHLIVESLLRSLVRKGFASWSGGKPQGSEPGIEITPGPPVSDYVIEDRR
jgi:Flp pilus assembly protein TadD